MYGLPQTVSLENKIIYTILTAHGCSLTLRTLGMCQNETIPIKLVLVVDDFGVEYEWKEDSQYLINALNAKSGVVAQDWEGNIFCAINLERDYI